MKMRKRLKAGDKVGIVLGGWAPFKMGYCIRRERNWWWVSERPDGHGLPFLRSDLALIEPIIDKEYEKLFI